MPAPKGSVRFTPEEIRALMDAGEMDMGLIQSLHPADSKVWVSLAQERTSGGKEFAEGTATAALGAFGGGLIPKAAKATAGAAGEAVPMLTRAAKGAWNTIAPIAGATLGSAIGANMGHGVTGMLLGSLVGNKGRIPNPKMRPGGPPAAAMPAAAAAPPPSAPGLPNFGKPPTPPPGITATQAGPPPSLPNFSQRPGPPQGPQHGVNPIGGDAWTAWGSPGHKLQGPVAKDIMGSNTGLSGPMASKILSNPPRQHGVNPIGGDAYTKWGSPPPPPRTAIDLKDELNWIKTQRAGAPGASMPAGQGDEAYANWSAAQDAKFPNKSMDELLAALRQSLRKEAPRGPKKVARRSPK